MIDVAKQVVHWRNSAQEDWDVACNLIATNRTRHGMFFAHLALEKLLKAIICKQTEDVAPRTHNLVRLTEVAGLSPGPEQLDTLADLNAFNIEGRYPEWVTPPPSLEEAANYKQRAEEVMAWLINKL